MGEDFLVDIELLSRTFRNYVFPLCKQKLNAHHTNQIGLVGVIADLSLMLGNYLVQFNSLILIFRFGALSRLGGRDSIVQSEIIYV